MSASVLVQGLPGPSGEKGEPGMKGDRGIDVSCNSSGWWYGNLESSIKLCDVTYECEYSWSGWQGRWSLYFCLAVESLDLVIPSSPPPPHAHTHTPSPISPLSFPDDPPLYCRVFLEILGLMVQMALLVRWDYLENRFVYKQDVWKVAESLQKQKTCPQTFNSSKSTGYITYIL